MVTSAASRPSRTTSARQRWPYAGPRARTTSVRQRWPYAGPAQSRLLLASLAIGIGSFLPWVDTAVGSFTGMAGPGAWTLYAAVLGLAGSLVRRSRLAAVHALLTGAVAVALPAWQGMRLLGLCGGGACLPGLGMVVVAAAGAVALGQVRPLLRTDTTAPR